MKSKATKSKKKNLETVKELKAMGIRYRQRLEGPTVVTCVKKKGEAKQETHMETERESHLCKAKCFVTM